MRQNQGMTPDMGCALRMEERIKMKQNQNPQKRKLGENKPKELL
jgi:hypothetical protein